VSALTEAANTIANWPALLGTKPLNKDLLQAIEVYNESEFTQPPPPPVIPAEITRETLTAVTATLAVDLVSVAEFDTAAKQIRDHLAQRVLNLAAESIDQTLDAMHGFQSAADSFVAAVCELPETLNLSSGSVAVANYEQAKDAHKQLEKFDSFLSSLKVIYGGRPEPALRCLKPVTREDFQLITDRQGSRKTYEGLYDHWVWAARNSVVFEAHTPPQCAELRAALEALPLERKRPKTAHLGNFAPVNRI
jgi:hypothetical protein